MYLPKHQYVKKTIEELDSLFNLKIGGRTQTSDSSILEQVNNSLNNQNTQVVVTSTGQIFSTVGINFDKGDFSSAIELIKTKESNDPTLFDNDRGSSIVSTKLPPSSKDKEVGVMKRCFYKNVSTGKVKEILKTKAVKLAKNRERYEQVVCIDWIIKGPLEDQNIKGYFLEGVKSKNEKTLQELTKLMPGTETLIENSAEYVENTVIQSADPIRSSNTDIVIPSPGKKL